MAVVAAALEEAEVLAEVVIGGTGEVVGGSRGVDERGRVQARHEIAEEALIRAVGDGQPIEAVAMSGCRLGNDRQLGKRQTLVPERARAAPDLERQPAILARRRERGPEACCPPGVERG